MNDLEKIKAELKREILAEISNDMPSRKNVDSLERIKTKYFYGPNMNDRHNGSRMQKLFGNDQHRVWDAVRTLTRIIFDKKNQGQLTFADQDEVERVCDSVCYLVCSLKAEMLKEDT
ncbi:MAG: hypothetical protein LBQ71_19425 [Hungatella sp.]|jgi:hypothetical protein|nr:hypothetical protein [Hungatella sp.]